MAAEGIPRGEAAATGQERTELETRGGSAGGRSARTQAAATISELWTREEGILEAGALARGGRGQSCAKPRNQGGCCSRRFSSPPGHRAEQDSRAGCGHGGRGSHREGPTGDATGGSQASHGFQEAWALSHGPWWQSQAAAKRTHSGARANASRTDL